VSSKLLGRISKIYVERRPNSQKKGRSPIDIPEGKCKKMMQAEGAITSAKETVKYVSGSNCGSNYKPN
jgi:hypothetical protein